MGLNLFGSESKSSNTSTDNRAVGDGEAIVATGQGTITINQQSAEALNLASTTVGETLQAIKQSNATSADIANKALGTTQSETQQALQQMVPVAIIAAIAWGLTRK